MLKLNEILNNSQLTELLFKTVNERAIISITDTNGVITKINKLFCDLSQYDESELIGKTHALINSSYHDKEYWDVFWKTIKAGNTWCGEVKNKAKDGSYYWVDCNVYPIKVNGNIESYLSIRFDITAKKKIEQEKIENEYNLKSMLDSASDGNILIGLDYKILFINKITQVYIKSILNKSVKIGDNVLDILEDKTKDTFLKHFKKAANGKYLSFEELIPLNKELKIWASFKFISIYSQNSKPIGIAINVIDINESKKTQEFIKEKDTLNRLIVENAKEGILVTDVNGNVLTANPEACELFGMAENELKLKNKYELIAESKEVIDEHIHIRKKYGYAQSFLYFRKKNGENFLCETSSSTYTNASGKTIATIIFKDITNERKLDLELKKERANLFAIINNTDEIIASLDKDYKFLEFNKTTVKIITDNFGKTIKKGDSVLDFVHPEKQQMLIGIFNKVLEGEQISFNEKFEVPLSNDYLYLETSVYPIIDDNNVTTGISIFSKNITEKVNIEKALIASENQIRAVFNSLSSIFFFCDLNYKIISFNQEASNFIKAEFNKMVQPGDNMLDYIIPYEKENFKASFNKTAKGQMVEKEKHTTLPSGQNIWFETAYAPVYDHNKQLIGVSINSIDITIRKKQSLEIEKIKTLLESTNAVAKLGSWDYNFNTKEQECSNEFLKIFEFINNSSKNVLEIFLQKIHPEDLPKLKQLVNEATANEKGFNCEYRIICDNGEIKYISSIVDVYKNTDNKITGLKGTVQDITERKKIEVEIERLSLIAKNSNEAIIITDNDRKITWVNNAFTKVSGYSLEEAIDKNPANLVQFEGSSITTKNYIRDNLIKGESIKCEIINKSKFGNTYWVDLKIQPLFDKDSKQIGFFSIQSDITERKLLEDHLRQYSKMLHDTNRIAVIGSWQYDLLTKSTTWDIITKIIHEVNLDYKPTEKDAIKLVTNSASKFQIKKSLYQLMKFGKKFDFEYEILTAKGHKKWVRVIAEGQVESKQCVRIYGITQDITERKHFNDNLIAKQKAEKANQIKTEFLANMSHEIRTPMNAILGFTSLLKKFENDPVQQKYIDGIYTGGINLMTLINNILDLSKIEAGQIDIVKIKTNLTELLSDLKKIFSAQLIESSNDLVLNLPDNIPPSILIDEFHLKQILINIIGNAIKFTHNGTITITVNYKFCKTQTYLDELNISVKDTGIGISQENLSVIFEPFKQVDSSLSKKFNGTGLGLSISKKLLHLMGGEIYVESKVNIGSEFTIVFKDLALKNKNQSEKQLLIPTAHYNFNKATVLLVEDTFSNREIVKGFLEDSNLKIIEAENGNIALQIMEQTKPDIILLDMMMPEMDGFETSKLIRKSEKDKNIPIVAITALSNRDETKERFEYCTDYIRKPVDRTILLDTIAKYIKHEKLNGDVTAHTHEKYVYLKLINSKKIHNTFYDLFNKVDSLRSNDEIIDLAGKMKNYAMENAEPYLKNFCKQLIESIYDFDIDKTNSLMDELKHEF